MSDDPLYAPISCELYSQLEMHIMHRDTLRMQWRGTDMVIHIEPIQPFDLQTIKDRGEYLFASTSEAQDLNIRLDRIIKFEKVE